MVLTYSKSMDRYGKALAILFSLLGIVLVIEPFCFWPLSPFEARHIVIPLSGLLIFRLGIVWFNLSKQYHQGKLEDPSPELKRLGLTHLILVPIMLADYLVLPLVGIVYISSPLHAIIFALSALIIIVSFFMARKYRKALSKEEDGAFLFKSQTRLGLNVALTYFVCFGTNYLQTGLIQIIMQSSPNLPAEEIVDDLGVIFMIFLVVQLVIGVAFSLQFLYFAFAQYIAGKEKVPMNLKKYFVVTKHLFLKYDLVFWFGIFINIILMAAAIGSAIRLTTAYLGLVLLYAFVLLIRLPTFFWKKSIEKRYEGDDYRIFREKHRIMIYTAINLFVLGVISFFTSSASSTKLLDNQEAFMIYAVFIPYSVLRIVMGIIAYIGARKNGDPYIQVSAYIGVLLTIFIVANTVYMVASMLSYQYPSRAQGFTIAGSILAISMNVYALLMSIVLLIIGILGLKGKRHRYFEDHKLAIMLAYAPIIKPSLEKKPLPVVAGQEAPLEGEEKDNALATAIEETIDGQEQNPMN